MYPVFLLFRVNRCTLSSYSTKIADVVSFQCRVSSIPKRTVFLLFTSRNLFFIALASNANFICMQSDIECCFCRYVAMVTTYLSLRFDLIFKNERHFFLFLKGDNSDGYKGKLNNHKRGNKAFKSTFRRSKMSAN